MEIVNTFTFNDTKLTVYGTSEKPMFKGKDVALMLEYKDTKKAIEDHVDKEDIKMWSEMKGDCAHPLSEMHPFTKFINESGVYALIFSSKKPIAKKFKHWVTAEVLPSIRKTGKYEHEYKTPKPMLTYRMETENDIHNKVVNFIRQQQEEKELLYTSTLGELQDTTDKRIEAWKKGYTKGIPDFILFNPSDKYKGLVIEFKSPKGNGELTNEQQQIIKHFKTLEYKTIISNDYDKIIITLNDYIRSIRIPCEYCKCNFKTNGTIKSHLRYFHRITKTTI